MNRSCLRISRGLRLCLAAAALPAAALAQATTYTYTGDLYASTQPPYSAGQRLTGSFTVDSPLPPFRPLSDLGPALAAMSLTDGVAVRNLSSSFLCSFEVATDGAGAISQWRISLRQTPYNPGDPQHSIDSSGAVGVIQGIDVVGTGPAAANPCGFVALAPTAYTTGPDGQGTWSSDHPLPSDPTIYAYTGDPYTAADPPYSVGGQLAGTVELAGPLPAFLPFTDISPALVDFSFADGVEVRTLANSFLCSFKVATDGAGAITRWDILLRRFPYNPGDPQHSIDTDGQTGIVAGSDFVGTGTAGVNPCDPISASPGANSSAQGTWTSDHPLPPDPTVYSYSGDPYAVADPPYTVGGALSASLTLAGPLPAFLPLTDARAAIVDFSFDDGIETRTPATSFVCNFELATDGAGEITAWRIELRRFPYNPGDPHHSIYSSGQPPGVIPGVDAVGTGTAPANPCGPMTLSPSATTFSQGTWSSDHPRPSAPTVYSYTGDPYEYADPPYVLGGNLSGTLELANPLPAFLPLTDIAPAIVAFAFDDGVAVRQLHDSFLCSFEVATDGGGAITSWRIALREFPYNPASPQRSVDSAGYPAFPEGNDFVGVGPAAVNPCGGIVLSPYASTYSKGAWSREPTASVLEVPALGAPGAAALVFMISGVALLRLRRRRAASVPASR